MNEKRELLVKIAGCRAQLSSLGSSLRDYGCGKGEARLVHDLIETLNELERKIYGKKEAA